MTETPPCRVCGKTETVICYPDDHSKTICPECCDTFEHEDTGKGHEWEYNRGERGDECQHCGILKRYTAHDGVGDPGEWLSYP